MYKKDSALELSVLSVHESAKHMILQLRLESSEWEWEHEWENVMFCYVLSCQNTVGDSEVLPVKTHFLTELKG